MADTMSREPPPPPRKTLRETHSEAARDRLLDAAVALLERGLEPTMRSVAAEAGTSERTIYRYFDSRDVLFQALRPRLMGKGGIPLCDTVEGLPDYACELFATFEANRLLVTTLLTSSWAVPYIRITRRENLNALRKLLDDAYPHAPEADRAAAASSLRAVLSGSGWSYLRDNCGLGSHEVTSHAGWLIGVVCAALQQKRA